MRRRDFIALLGGAAAWPLAARAQQRAVPVIGYLSAGTVRQSSLLSGQEQIFWQVLNEGGYIEGQNLEILIRQAESHYDRLPSLASDLVGRRVAVIIAGGGAPAVAATAATKTVPIVFSTATDPVALGIVASLSRPGGNATGVSAISEAAVVKGIQFMHELVPGANSIAVLGNPVNPITAVKMRDAENAARTLGLRLVTLSASNPEEIELAFGVFAQQERPAGLVVYSDAMLLAHTDQLVALATRHRVPTINAYRAYALAGGLMSYGGEVPEIARIVGNYVVRILRGEKPANLPVQLVTRLALVINLKTAKALGLTVPPTLLAIADEVIE